MPVSAVSPTRPAAEDASAALDKVALLLTSAGRGTDESLTIAQLDMSPPRHGSPHRSGLQPLRSTAGAPGLQLVWDVLRNLQAAARAQQRDTATLRKDFDRGKSEAPQQFSAAVSSLRDELRDLRRRLEELSSAQAAAESAGGGSAAQIDRHIRQLEAELRRARDSAEQHQQSAAVTAQEASEALRRCAALDQEVARARAEGRRGHAAVQQLERQVLDGDEERQTAMAVLNTRVDALSARCAEDTKKLTAAGHMSTERMVAQLRAHERRMEETDNAVQRTAEQLSDLSAKMQGRDEEFREQHHRLALAANDAADTAQRALAEAGTASGAAAAARCAAVELSDAVGRRVEDMIVNVAAEAAAAASAVERRSSAAQATASSQLRDELRQGLKEVTQTAAAERDAMRTALTREFRDTESRLKEGIRASCAEVEERAESGITLSRTELTSRIQTAEEEWRADSRVLRADVTETGRLQREAGDRCAASAREAAARHARTDDDVRSLRDANEARLAAEGDLRRKIRDVETGLAAFTAHTTEQLPREIRELNARVDAVGATLSDVQAALPETCRREARNAETTLRAEAAEAGAATQKRVTEVAADCDALYAVWGIDKRRARRARGADERQRVVLSSPFGAALRRAAAGASSVPSGPAAEMPPPSVYAAPVSSLRSVGMDVNDAAAGRRGAVVSSVVPAGPASLAGVREGDIVLYLGGRRVDSRRDLVDAVRAAQETGGLTAKLTRVPAGKVEPDTTQVQLSAGTGEYSPRHRSPHRRSQLPASHSLWPLSWDGPR